MVKVDWAEKKRDYIVKVTVLAVLFVIIKLVILIGTKTPQIYFPGFYFYDLAAALVIGLFILLGRVVYYIVVSILIILYMLNIANTILFGGFIESSVFIFLADGFSNFIDSILLEIHTVVFFIPAVTAGLYIFVSSRKFQFLKVDRKLVYTVRAFLIVFALAGLFYFIVPNRSLTYHIFRQSPFVVFLQSFLPEHHNNTVANFDEISAYPDSSSGTSSEDPLAYIKVGQGKYNLVFILMESTGYIATGHNDAAVMPNFNELKKNGLYWNSLYAVVPESIKSIFALHAGAYPLPSMLPYTHTDMRLKLRQLPDYFKEAGYATALFHAGRFSYYRKLNLLNDAGYDLLLDCTSLPNAQVFEKTSWGIDDEAMYSYAKEWVGEQRQPFFLFLINLGPHHPYFPPRHFQKPFPGTTNHDNFINSVNYEDSLLGDLIADFRSKKLIDNTIFVIMADHGQAFGEHMGNHSHSSNIYEENIRVELLIYNPRIISEPHTFSTPCIMPDVMPTILDLYGRLDDFEGNAHSLLRPVKQRMLFHFTGYSGHKLGLRDGKYKYIYRQEINYSELYDLQSDPQETNNLSWAEPQRTRYYKERVLKWLDYMNGYIKRNSN